MEVENKMTPVEICPNCGCIILDDLTDMSCWCGVKIAATDPQRELDAINEDTPGWIKYEEKN